MRLGSHALLQGTFQALDEQNTESSVGVSTTRKNAQVVTSLQTSCYKSLHKLSTSCVRTACS
jgi:hypothetical protein